MKFKEVFETFWGHKSPGDLYLNLWVLPSMHTYNFNLNNDLHKIDETINTLMQNQNDIYYMMGLLPHKSGKNSKGKAIDICAIPGFWMDIDIKGEGHKEENLPDEEQVADLMKAIELKPTVIVNSGGGRHVYWLFQEPWIFTDGDNEKAKQLSKNFQNAVKQIAMDKGYKLDTTSNLDRVLRVPGTKNYKTEPPRDVAVMDLDLNARYTIKNFETFIDTIKPKVKPAQKKRGKKPAQKKGGNKLAKVEADAEKIAENCAWLKHCRDDPDTLTEPEWFGMITILRKCSNSETLIHEWSKDYSGYTHGETQKKIENAGSYGPVTCETIETNYNASRICQNCPHKSKIKSPIILGYSLKSISELDDSLNEHLLVPPTYYAKQTGIVQNIEDSYPVNVITAPIFMTKRLINSSTQDERIELTWLRDGEIKSQAFERKCIFFSRHIEKLARYGIPVTSNNAKYVIPYFEAFEALNRDNLDVSYFTEHMGWQDGDKFLIGRKILSGDCSNESLEFISDDDGAQQFVKGLSTKGDFKSWIEAVNDLYIYTPVMAMIFASFASPLLEILEINGFTCDISYETSKGKTIALRTAASVWGNPDESSQDSIVYSWDNTQVWIERTAGLLRGLPMFLDDTKLAGSVGFHGDSKNKVTSTIYQITNGRGRGRGAIDGTRSTSAWRLVLLSTGEQAAIDFTTGQGGAQARVLQLWTSPFGENQFHVVEKLNQCVKANFGHAGIRFVQFIMDNRDDWPLWREAFAELKIYFSEMAGENTVAKRTSSMFAVLYFTAVLVHAAIPELKPDRAISDLFSELWDLFALNDNKGDVATDALKNVYEWAVANQKKFYNQSQDNREPNAGWAGKWEKDDKIIFIPRQLRDLLKDKGFESKSVLKIWSERDWLELGSNNRSQKTAKIDGKNVSCYHLKAKSLSKILETT